MAPRKHPESYRQVLNLTLVPQYVTSSYQYSFKRHLLNVWDMLDTVLTIGTPKTKELLFLGGEHKCEQVQLNDDI